VKKHIIYTLLTLCLCAILLSSCGTAPTEKPDADPPIDDETIGDSEEENDFEDAEDEEPSLAQFRETISESGADFGVAYLGYCGENFDDIADYIYELGLCGEYAFIEDMDETSLISTASNEMYLIVPAKRETVYVYEAILNDDYGLDKGELLGKSDDGKPFILLCNISEIMPNAMVYTETFGYYYPALSGMDGKLVPDEYIYDFSPYGAINEYFDIQNGEADGADSIFCGEWFGEAEDGDGELMSMCLSIFPDGTADYTYGIGNSELIEWFTGEWSVDADSDRLVFDLYGGEIGDDPESFYVDPREFISSFSWDMDYLDDGTYVLLLDHEDGDPLLYGTEGETFEFLQMAEEDYSFLCASWYTGDEYTDTYLELFDDGTVHYYVYEGDETIADLRGYWYAQDATLCLELAEEGDDEFSEGIYGEYKFNCEDEYLTLSPTDGAFPLTDYMAENEYDSFIISGLG